MRFDPVQGVSRGSLGSIRSLIEKTQNPMFETRGRKKENRTSPVRCKNDKIVSALLVDNEENG